MKYTWCRLAEFALAVPAGRGLIIMFGRSSKDKVDWSDEQITRKFYDRYRESLFLAPPINRRVVEECIYSVYNEAKLPQPDIVWCHSFYQLLIMPSVIVGILQSDVWDLIDTELTSIPRAEDWDQHWNALWPMIWEKKGKPFFKSMLPARNVAAYYDRLELPLVERTKQETSRLIHKGKKVRSARVEDRSAVLWKHWEKLTTSVSSEIGVLLKQKSSNYAWSEIARGMGILNDIGRQLENVFDALTNRLGDLATIHGGSTHFIASSHGLLATSDFLLQAMPAKFRPYEPGLRIWLAIAGNVSAMLSIDGIVFVCEKPLSIRIERGRLNNHSGPALTQSDGFSQYAWNGVLVPDFIVDQPEMITYDMIERCDNIEVRRIMLERYTLDRYIMESRVTSIQQDEFGTLYRRNLRNEEPLVVVRVKNSTKEPDGTFKYYCLRVPPNITTAKAAVAWTFRMDAESYDPLIET